jgi:hypothetical protein
MQQEVDAGGVLLRQNLPGRSLEQHVGQRLLAVCSSLFDEVILLLRSAISAL